MMQRIHFILRHGFVLFALLVILNACRTTNVHEEFWTESNSPKRIGRMVIENLLSRSDIMMYRSRHLNTVHYAEACTGMGAVRLACLLNDSLLLNLLETRYRDLIAHFDTLPTNHVDANVLGILPLEFYMCSGGLKNLHWGITFAEKQWDNPLPNGLTRQTRFWIDDIFMIGSLQILAYRASGNKIYMGRAAQEIDAYLQKLQQPNGLFFHGEDAPFFWGRGNGWVAAGLAELIRELPEDNEHYSSILNGYKRMMEALLRYQTPEGMWRQLVDKEESWEESSATAMFGYALKIGVDKGVLSDKQYTLAYQKAWLALADRIDADGALTGICVGTGQSADIQYYLNRPKTAGDLHGQAPVLWFASNLLGETN